MNPPLSPAFANSGPDPQPGQDSAKACRAPSVRYRPGLVLAGLAASPCALASPAAAPPNAFLWAAGALILLALLMLLRHNAARNHARRKEINNELLQRATELALARAKFTTLFELNPVPISITRLSDGCYYEVNSAWERQSGWTRDEAIMRKARDLDFWLSAEERDTYLATLRLNGSLSNFATRFRTRNGQIRHFLSSCEIIDYGNEPCVFSTLVDITEQRQAEARLIELNAELERRVAERTAQLENANASLASSLNALKQTRDEMVHLETMASLGSMVAGISHELNTPLGNALTVSTALQDQVREFRHQLHDAPMTRHALDDFLDDLVQGGGLVTRSLQRAAELVTSFKQVAVDQSSERRRRFALDELVNDVLSTLRPMLRQHPVELKVLLDKGITLDSFPGPLGQVIVNLVQNALLHGLDGASRGVIRVEALAADEDRVELRIADDGRGINPEHLPRIFDPFFTTRLGNGGSGLGLSIVHRIVTNILGGTIRVNAAPGEGASFRILLPRTAPLQILEEPAE